MTRTRIPVATLATLVLASLVLTSLVLTTCSRPAPESEFTARGVSLDLAELRLETLSEITYDFQLTLPEGVSDPVQGTVVLAFEWQDPNRRDVVLDFKDPTRRVHRFSINGIRSFLLAVNDHIVVPAHSLSPGRNTVEIRFQAGDEALNRNKEFLYTLFVPDRARFSLPVFDQPSLKARFRLSLELPPGWKAVSNAPLASEADTADGGQRLRFAETRPLPTYLFAFAAGRFQVEEAERDGRTLRMFHRETDAEKLARNRTDIFDLHFDALDWLEEYTGIPYPFEKLDFVLVPPFQYGGMEHAGAIFYRARRLLLDESATQGDFLGRAGLIAHEVAHMWFGDLVTMRWFDDVWLKEVFAGFFAAKIINPSFPEVNHDLRFLLSHHPRAYEVDRTAGANPIRQPLRNLNEAGSLYGAIIYQKAPVVMRQLELIVGERAFREGMREYLHTYGFGNATWTDLVSILDQRAPQDLAAWSSVWIDQPGRPAITATPVIGTLPTADGDTTYLEKIEIGQSDTLGDGRLWPQALEVVLGYGDTVVRRPISLTGERAQVGAGERLAPPDFVLPDGSGIGYGWFRLDEASRTYLTEHLPDLPDPLIRGIGWITLWDAVLESEVEPGAFLQLALEGLAAERDEQNIQRILRYLGTTYWRLLRPEQRLRVAPRVEEALWQELTSAESSTLRGSLFRAYRDLALSSDAIEALRDIWSGESEVPGLTLSERDLGDLAFELALREAEGWEEILEEQATRFQNPDRRERFEFIRPALSADEAVRESFFASLADAANREHEPWVGRAVIYLHHPLRAGHAVQFITPSLELLEEIQRTGDIFFPKSWLDATLWGHNSPAAASMVRDFLESRPAYPRRLREKTLQSADMLFRAERIVHGAS